MSDLAKAAELVCGAKLGLGLRLPMAMPCLTMSLHTHTPIFPSIQGEAGTFVETFLYTGLLDSTKINRSTCRSSENLQ